MIRKGDYVKFGSYPQNKGDVKAPIEWLVLEVNGNEAFLVSRYGLDCKPYNEEYKGITWEDCALRKWLNDDFLKAAFSAEDQQKIKLSEVVNDNNRRNGTRGGNNTKDHVFCLSLGEARRYFKNDSERQCQRTSYARNQGVWAWENDSNGCCFWWLRSPGFCQFHAANVFTDGALLTTGNDVNSDSIAVRPALWLILDQ